MNPGGHRGGRGGGRGRGRGRGYRGGRPPVIPEVQKQINITEGEYNLELTQVELEALRLVDHKNLTQEQAAEIMKISRGTLWRIIQEARNKVIQALMSGKNTITLDFEREKEEK